MRSTILVTLLVFSASVYAEGLDYTYLQGSYGQITFDDALLDVDGDGFGISGSYAATDSIHIYGEYQTADLDFGVDLDFLEAGVGYHMSVSERLDIVAELGYIQVELGAPGFPSFDEDGLTLGVALRGMASEALELNGGVDYVEFNDADADGETRFNVGFQYNFTETFSAGASATVWDDFNIIKLSARYNF